jgi:hypothetical protein
MEEPLVYEKINDAFDETPAGWRLEDGQLVVFGSGFEQAVPFDRIARLRFKHAPIKLRLNRSIVMLTTKGRYRSEIDNYSFAGLGDFEDKSLQWLAVVLALMRRLREGGHEVEVTGGASWPGWIAALAVTIAATALILATFFAGGVWLILIKVALIAVYLPMMIGWLRRSRPVRGTLEGPPLGAV